MRLRRRDRTSRPRSAEGEERQQPEELHARLDLTADRLRQGGPEEAGEHGGGGEDADRTEEGDEARVDERGEPEAGEEAQHDGRQRGHDFHHRLDDALVFRAKELGDIDGRRQGDRNGEQQGVEGALHRAVEERDEGVLGLELVGTRTRLPGVGRAGRAFVPDLAEERAPGGFRVMIDDAPAVELAVGGERGEAVVVAREGDLTDRTGRSRALPA